MRYVLVPLVLPFPCTGGQWRPIACPRFVVPSCALLHVLAIQNGDVSPWLEGQETFFFGSCNLEDTAERPPLLQHPMQGSFDQSFVARPCDFLPPIVGARFLFPGTQKRHDHEQHIVPCILQRQHDLS